MPKNTSGRQIVMQIDRHGNLSGQITPHVALRRPIHVEFWREGDETVAAATGLRIHAFGARWPDALVELGAAIVEQYEWLVSLDDRLSPALAEDRSQLRDLLRFVDA